MNKLILISIATCLILSACGDDEPKDTVREIRMEVSAETGITYYWGDDKKEHPIECMLVKLPDNPDAWQRMAFRTIEGFTYERGHEYYLSIRKTILANPPADAPNCTYSLLKILSDRLVKTPLSCSGVPMVSLADFMAFIRKAILWPRLRMVWSPSMSFSTSSGV